MKVKAGITGVVLTGLLAAAVFLDFMPRAAQAPDVTFTTITGKQIELKALRGKPVIVTFWATDCPNCIQEIPNLIELYDRYHPEGLEIIAVTMYYDPPSHVVAMTRDKLMPYDVALDLKAEHARAFGDVRLTPAHFVIAPDGRLVMDKVGVFELPDMKMLIESLLKEAVAQSDV